MKISIIIPTYNRASRVQDAINSSLATFDGLPVECEVIVIDDASTDRTVERLRARYTSEISTGALQILESPTNRGVTGSKNVGFEIATGDWVVFLDSDDTFLPGVGDAVARTLHSNADRPIVFFRCFAESGNIVGTPIDRDLLVDLTDFLANGTCGESLPAINRRIIADAPYLETLKGYEGLGYCRLIRRHGPALLSAVVARRYDCSGHDRLSSRRGLRRRMLLLARGHRLLLQEFGAQMSWRKRVGYKMKIAMYGAIGTLHAFVGGKQE